MAKRTKKFKTEVQQLLDLVIHSLYSKKEIFLRELISNSSDAIDRANFEALTNKKMQKELSDGRIKITPDKEANTLSVSDNGIGMTAEEVEANIGTIANSGTRKFLEELQKGKKSTDLDFIGQFGVGFYAAFMVADKVTLLTRRMGAKPEEGVSWTSAGTGNYSIAQVEKETPGTEIILHLKEDANEHLEEWKIRNIIKEYSDYIEYPVVMDVTRTKQPENEGDPEEEVTEEETLNSMKSIWKKSKSDVTEEEYHEFYKHISHDYTDPLKIIHYAAEGTLEFKALMYIPRKAPFDLYMQGERKGLHLYVKNVYISDDCKELMPEYLRFIKGVVDSSDLPLNVSREMLQDDAIIRKIRKSVVGRILGAMTELKDKERDDYLGFYQEFGNVLKEGLHGDFENADKLKNLLLFLSTNSEEGKPVSLKEYVDRMPEDQKEIYYLSGDNMDTLLNSPHLEAFKSKGYEVLFMVDRIDEWVIPQLTEYDGKKLKAVDRGDIDLDDETEKDAKEEERKKATEDFKDLTEFIAEKLKDDIKEVRLSSRLTESPCCLVSDENAMNANMERIMRAMNQDVPPVQRILELNPSHPLLPTMQSLMQEDKESTKLADYVELLHDQALLTEGSPIKNPMRFSQLVSDLMVAAK